MRFLKNNLWFGAAVGVVSLSTFLSLVILFNWFESLGRPSEYDGVVMLVSITSLFSLAAHLGIPLSVTKLIARSARRMDTVPVGEIISGSLWMTLLATLPFMVLLGAAGGVLQGIGKAPGWGLWLVTTPLWLLSAAVLRTAGGVANGFQRMDYSAALLVLIEPLRLAGLAVVWWVGASLEAVVWVYTGVAVVSLVLGVIILWIFFRRMGVRPVRPSREAMRLIGREGFPWLYIPHVTSEMTVRLLIVLVGFFALREGEVGDFRMYVLTAGLILLPIQPLVATLLPRLAAARDEDLRRSGAPIYRLTGLYAVGMMALFLFGGGWLLRLLSRGALAEAAPMLPLLAVARVGFAVALVPDAMLRSRRTARANAVMEAVRFAAAAALGVGLIAGFGAPGAAIAYAAVMVGGTLAQVVMVRSLLGVGLGRESLEFLVPIAVLGAGYLVGWGAGLALGLTAAAAAVSYGAGLIGRKGGKTT